MESVHNSVREGSRLLVHLANMTLVNNVFQITSYGHPIEIFPGVCEALVCSHIGHGFMGDSHDFDSDIGFFIDCFIGNIWTVSTLMLPSFENKSIPKDPTRMVGAVADHVIERTRGLGFSNGVIPLAFEVFAELDGTNIKGSGVLVRDRVVVIDRGMRDR